MRVLGVVIALALCVSGGALGVQVRDGDRSFPLEAVKQLKEMMGLNDDVNPHLAEESVVAVCRDPLLPQSFQPVCQENGAAGVVARLVSVLSPSDPCEICANPSCFGCRR